MGTHTQGEGGGEGRGGEITVQCAWFTVHDSQFMVHDLQRERGGREGGWHGGREEEKESKEEKEREREREREGGRAGKIER